MKSEPNTLLLRSWLHMLSQGGRWTARELADETGATPEHIATQCAYWAGKGRNIKRYEPEPTAGYPRVRFGVDSDCRVPPGISVRQVVEALRAAGAEVA